MICSCFQERKTESTNWQNSGISSSEKINWFPHGPSTEVGHWTPRDDLGLPSYCLKVKGYTQLTVISETSGSMDHGVMVFSTKTIWRGNETRMYFLIHFSFVLACFKMQFCSSFVCVFRKIYRNIQGVSPSYTSFTFLSTVPIRQHFQA